MDANFTEDRWRENAKGNFVRIDDDRIVATVFRRYEAWQISIQSGPITRFVANEAFESADAARDRADEILNGAECSYSRPSTPGPSSTPWQTQAKRSNGAPTYGRRLNGVTATVRMATSSKWYFIEYGASGTSAPEGWSPTAQAAMALFDRKRS